MNVFRIGFVIYSIFNTLLTRVLFPFLFFFFLSFSFFKINQLFYSTRVR